MPAWVSGSSISAIPSFQYVLAVSALQSRQTAIERGPVGFSAMRSSIILRVFKSMTVARARAGAVSAPSGSSLMHAPGPVNGWCALRRRLKDVTLVLREEEEG